MVTGNQFVFANTVIS